MIGTLDWYRPVVSVVMIGTLGCDGWYRSVVSVVMIGTLGCDGWYRPVVSVVMIGTLDWYRPVVSVVMIGTLGCDGWYRSGGSTVEERLLHGSVECCPAGQVYPRTRLGELALCLQTAHRHWSVMIPSYTLLVLC